MSTKTNARPMALVTVMTCQDPAILLEVLRASSGGHRRMMPAGIHDEADLRAAMAGGLAFLVAYKGRADGRARPEGAVAYRWDHGALRVVHVSVRDGARNLGVGRRLVQAVENVASALGAPRVAVSPGEDEGRVTFLRRLGYESYGEDRRQPMLKVLVSE
ncbi:MAG: GNAT family N-acetyltransferase [Candidatus Sericytochromatia bacterium]|nr:GNAT family N-acetyltransferase [Candidatus Sericytochromatia bacterium]